MTFSLPRLTPGRLWALGLLILAVVGFAARDAWLPAMRTWVQSQIASRKSKLSLDGQGHEDGHDHGHDDHAHAGHDHAHDAANSLELSAQARGNIGLTDEFIQPVRLQTFRKTVTMPGIIVERPGRTRVQVSTPMAGVITHVHAVQGEAVAPGTLLFQLRITAAELVSTQTDLLKTVGELDIENREIARLTKVTESDAIPRKVLLERQYAKEKLEALLAAQKEALRLLGLSDRQIDDISTRRRLLSELQIVAPHVDDHSAEELQLTEQFVRPVSFQKTTDTHPAGNPEAEAPLVLQRVNVHKGQTVAAGETLAIMADYSELYIEGQAFEQDLAMLTASAQHGWKISAVIEGANDSITTVKNLEPVYAASEIRPESRTLPFYVRLPNEIARTIKTEDGQRFIDWKYRLGQRLQVLVPVEEWTDQIVLPVEALAQEGADYFVFQQNSDHFDRLPVRVVYRDQSTAVVANDGSIFPGDVIALRGAHQMLIALKNKSGGGVDPHAGHNH